MDAPACNAPGYELRFCSLFNAGRAYAFPCDASGKVDLDGLSARCRANYFFARGMVGHEFDVPKVVPVSLLASLAE